LKLPAEVRGKRKEIALLYCARAVERVTLLDAPVFRNLIDIDGFSQRLVRHASESAIVLPRFLGKLSWPG
jgi:hypothetical protein